MRVDFPLLQPLWGAMGADRQGALAQSRMDDRLQIVHVPSKQQPYLTYVYNIEINRVLGYVERNFAKKLCFIFGKNFCIDGSMEQVYKRETGEFVAQFAVYDHTSYMLPYLETLPFLHGQED